jgi:hypothetical protein
MYASLIYIYARQEAYHPLVGDVPSGGGGPPQGGHVPGILPTKKRLLVGRFARLAAFRAVPTGLLAVLHQYRYRVAAPGTLMEPGLDDVESQGDPIPPRWWKWFMPWPAFGFLEPAH